MIFMLLSILIIGLSLTGVGCLAGRLFGLRSVRNPCLYWWLGFFASSTLSMFFSLFYPVNIIVLIVFFAIGLIGLPFLYGEYKNFSVKGSKKLIEIFVYIAIILLFVFAFLLAVPELMGAGDTALYHAQTVRWLNEYGTPPGLGNLHARLAFNSLWLSFAALFDNGPWDNRSECLLPALAWIGAFLYFFHELLFARKNGVRLYALCILAWAIRLIRGVYPNLYYDDPVHIINAIVVLESYYLFDNMSNKPFEEKINDVAGVLMLSIGAFMIKPIGAVSLIFTGTLAVLLLLRSRGPFGAWMKILCPSVFALTVWMIRNILLSGYPLYPVPVLSLPFDWTMTYTSVKGNYDDVIGWARMPGSGYLESLSGGFLFWFKPWLIRNLHNKNFLVLVVLPSLFSIFFWFLVVRFVRSKKVVFFLSWSSLNILYWFLSAPDIRFGTGFFLITLGLSLLFLFPSDSRFDFSVFWDKKIIRWTFRYMCILAVIGTVGMAVVSSSRSLFTIGSAQSNPVKEYVVKSSMPFIIWIPLDDADDRTGNSPLPSAPYPTDNLEMRVYGDLRKGFRSAK